MTNNKNHQVDASPDAPLTKGTGNQQYETSHLSRSQSGQLQRNPPNLTGVAETTLLTLWNRAHFSREPHAIIDDTLSIQLVSQIDANFWRRFPRPNPMHAIRSRWADEHIQSFMERLPDSAVICLGEGLETQFWRIDNGIVHWYSVDLPETIDARIQLLPPTKRNITIPGSALNTEWLELVPNQSPVMISAAGLLMYFTPEENLRLLRNIVKHFPSGEILFDTIPRWYSRQTLATHIASGEYVYPPMRTGIAPRQVPRALKACGMQCLSIISYPDLIRKFFVDFDIPHKHTIAPGLVHAAW